MLWLSFSSRKSWRFNMPRASANERRKSQQRIRSPNRTVGRLTQATSTGGARQCEAARPGETTQAPGTRRKTTSEKQQVNMPRTLGTDSQITWRNGWTLSGRIYRWNERSSRGWKRATVERKERDTKIAGGATRAAAVTGTPTPAGGRGPRPDRPSLRTKS
ncbi:unnamed protein product [Amoebophrya sp. A120]|nr:unnamed protein product [Amoebophrya sp. A120]|eukprot:GSA120T00017095001.1